MGSWFSSAQLAQFSVWKIIVDGDTSIMIKRGFRIVVKGGGSWRGNFSWGSATDEVGDSWEIWSRGADLKKVWIQRPWNHSNSWHQKPSFVDVLYNPVGSRSFQTWTWDIDSLNLADLQMSVPKHHSWGGEPHWKNFFRVRGGGLCIFHWCSNSNSYATPIVNCNQIHVKLENTGWTKNVLRPLLRPQHILVQNLKNNAHSKLA